MTEIETTTTTVVKDDGSMLVCDHCGGRITVYYSKSYKGDRGRCAVCKVDFPLE